MKRKELTEKRRKHLIHVSEESRKYYMQFRWILPVLLLILGLLYFLNKELNIFETDSKDAIELESPSEIIRE